MDQFVKKMFISPPSKILRQILVQFVLIIQVCDYWSTSLVDDFVTIYKRHKCSVYTSVRDPDFCHVLQHLFKIRCTTPDTYVLIFDSVNFQTLFKFLKILTSYNLETSPDVEILNHADCPYSKILEPCNLRSILKSWNIQIS